MVYDNELIQSRLDQILPYVQKPGRYTGGEYNQVRKDWAHIQTKIALVFADIYEIGMSNLGLAILYQQINQRFDALAERAFCPWIDMEDQLRKNQLPLYSLENKVPLKYFDIVGLTLPYETLYTNTLNLLDLAHIPIRSKDRDESHPLVIAGGGATYNPEPMHAFIDAFVIGEGEEVIHEIIDTYQDWKKKAADRSTLFEMLSCINGVYVPSLYKAFYYSDKTFSHLEKLHVNAPDTILKRIVAQLPPPPDKFIVPYLDITHNRIPIEIMRGCTRGCRFCHAGMVTRPVRERPVDEIVSAIDAAIRNTGYEEVGLLSLSSSDYTHIQELAEKIAHKYSQKHLSISLPSLRIESISINLMEALRISKGGSFTLAPEAATEKIRNMINKPISDQQLLEVVEEIYSRGWTTIKLYFMIGHPTETIEHVEAIVSLCRSVLKIGYQALGKKAQLNVGISTFIPKPHTPFQWERCDSMENITNKQALLKKGLRGRNIKLTWVDPQETMLEALLSRGDRQLAEVIFHAWQLGAKFDAWSEHFRYDLWLESTRHLRIDPEFYTTRPRQECEAFPWDHISASVRKDYLYEDYQWSKEGKFRVDCRDHCYACGVLPTFAELRKQTPREAWKCPEVKNLQAPQISP